MWTVNWSFSKMASDNITFQDETHGLQQIEVDWTDAALFAQAAYSPNDSQYVVQGMNFEPNFSNNTLAVSTGWAKLHKEKEKTLDHTDDIGVGQRPKDILDGVHPVQIDYVDDVVLNAGSKNHIWLVANLGEGDDSSIIVTQNKSISSDVSLRIGTVDTTNGTYDDTINRLPDGDFGELSVKNTLEGPTVATVADLPDPTTLSQGSSVYVESKDRYYKVQS